MKSHVKRLKKSNQRALKQRRNIIIAHRANSEYSPEAKPFFAGSRLAKSAHVTNTSGCEMGRRIEKYRPKEKRTARIGGSFRLGYRRPRPSHGDALLVAWMSGEDSRIDIGASTKRKSDELDVGPSQRKRGMKASDKIQVMERGIPTEKSIISPPLDLGVEYSKNDTENPIEISEQRQRLEGSGKGFPFWGSMKKNHWDDGELLEFKSKEEGADGMLMKHGNDDEMKFKGVHYTISRDNTDEGKRNGDLLREFRRIKGWGL